MTCDLRTQNASFKFPNTDRKTPLGRHRSDCDTSCTPSAIKKNLRHQTTDTMSDNDWRRFQFANDLLVMIDKVGQSKIDEAAWIASQ